MRSQKHDVLRRYRRDAVVGGRRRTGSTPPYPLLGLAWSRRKPSCFWTWTGGGVVVRASRGRFATWGWWSLRDGGEGSLRDDQLEPRCLGKAWGFLLLWSKRWSERAGGAGVSWNRLPALGRRPSAEGSHSSPLFRERLHGTSRSGGLGFVEMPAAFLGGSLRDVPRSSYVDDLRVANEDPACVGIVRPVRSVL